MAYRAGTRRNGASAIGMSGTLIGFLLEVRTAVMMAVMRTKTIEPMKAVDASGCAICMGVTHDIATHRAVASPAHQRRVTAGRERALYRANRGC